jgi:hypothetical protein
MPFNTTQVLPPDPPDGPGPDVQIFLHGLLMLSPNQNSTECEVGVHRLTVQHKLSVEVRVKGENPPDPPLLRLAGTLDSAGLTIGIEPGSRGVSKFVADGELNRAATDNNMDFRWALDLQTLDPDQPKMLLQESGISPKIRIKDGIFHSARLTNPATVDVKLKNQGTGVPTPLGRVARIIGANIYLQQGENVVLRWFGDGKRQELVIPKKKAADRPALIYIDNSPALMPSGKPDHSEFVEYFKVITNATDTSKQFDVVFDDPPGTNPHGTDRFPCMSVVIDG